MNWLQLGSAEVFYNRTVYLPANSSFLGDTHYEEVKMDWCLLQFCILVCLAVCQLILWGLKEASVSLDDIRLSRLLNLSAYLINFVSVELYRPVGQLKWCTENNCFVK